MNIFFVITTSTDKVDLFYSPLFLNILNIIYQTIQYIHSSFNIKPTIKTIRLQYNLKLMDPIPNQNCENYRNSHLTESMVEQKLLTVVTKFYHQNQIHESTV